MFGSGRGVRHAPEPFIWETEVMLSDPEVVVFLCGDDAQVMLSDTEVVMSDAVVLNHAEVVVLHWCSGVAELVLR
ncbi:hypothetical protein NDU88_004428 [Pleurodeles waltl]|uniref:Uncharacterized protein n=1 Tax=Pleurodeles waltl TaxID=8319 RepID=A0AAV7V2Z7_PLEWA|nr:hypothetical protein NDU88_004428 [Pleurodeles waltl]